MHLFRYRNLMKVANHVKNDFLNLGKDLNKLDEMQSFQELAGLVSTAKKEDFSINNKFFTQNNIHKYCCSTLFESEDKNICFGLFILPKGYCIPMHDHPSMYVFMKVLHGSAKSFSYDIKDRSDIKHQFLFKQQLLKNQADGLLGDNLDNMCIKVEKLSESILEEGDTDIVKPQRGNLHQFNASEGEDFIFFNCFIPHYDDKTRFTNFYEIQNKSSKIAKAKILKTPPVEYQKHYISLNLEEMPFFLNELPFYDNEHCCKQLSNYLSQQNYITKMKWSGETISNSNDNIQQFNQF